LFEKVDVIVTPTTAITPPKYPLDWSSGEANTNNLSDIMRYVFPGNFLGFPSITIPCGYDEEGAPIGFQVMTDLWNDNLAMKVALFVESLLDRKVPKVYTNII
jgi:Asp-tRNA(Asn)/Glu-tRNA(Gln) amidotransferase A subunit family amidase